MYRLYVHDIGNLSLQTFATHRRFARLPNWYGARNPPWILSQPAAPPLHQFMHCLRGLQFA